MQRHTEIYFEAFGFDTSDFIPCEICGTKAVDTAHIDARGIGGDPKGLKDRIENLMGKCRKCHNDYGDVLEAMALLYRIHKIKMLESGVTFDSDWIDKQIEKYEQRTT